MITASSKEEAIAKARLLFMKDPHRDFVVVDGAATVGGAASFGNACLVLYRRGNMRWATGSDEIAETKKRLVQSAVDRLGPE